MALIVVDGIHHRYCGRPKDITESMEHVRYFLRLFVEAIPGKPVDDLLSGPLRRWVLGDVDIPDTAMVVGQDHAHAPVWQKY